MIAKGKYTRRHSYARRNPISPPGSRSETLRELEAFLGPDEATPAYAEVAAKLSHTENTIAAALRQMRHESAPFSGTKSLTR